MKQRLSFLLFSLFLFFQTTIEAQVFSNTTVEGCNAWNSNNDWNTALSRSITTSGLPVTGLSATGTILREVRVRLGNSECRGNLSSYRLRITNPQGVSVEIANGLASTTSSIWIDMKFRDDIALERLKEYPGVSVQASYYPHSIGYYALETDGSFNNFNTSADPNGIWLFEIIENTTSEVSFEKVELVFGPPIAVRDVTSCSSNNFCSGASCVYDGVFRGNNNGYSILDPQYPGNTVNGCSWNGRNNNSAWFSFIPTSTTARITISGMLNSATPTPSDMQPIVVKANGNCGIPTIVPAGGCPKDQTINNRSYSNDITINPSPNTGGISTGSIYFNGISDNCEFNLSGLTVGDTYYLYVDGNGGASSFFYIEVENGVSTPCDFCCTPITLTGPASVCSGASPVNFFITGGTGTGTWSVTPASAGTISSAGVFTPASGITSDILAQVTYTEGDCSRTADIVVSKCTTFGIFATAPWLVTCLNNTPNPTITGSFFNTTGQGEDLIDRTEKKNFNDTFLGTYVQNSRRLILRGAEVKTFKNLSLSNVCSAKFYYRVVQSGGTAGAFTSIDLPFFSNCNTSNSQFEVGGGPCKTGDQKWQEVLNDNEAPVDLTSFAPGTYTLQVYYEVTGDENSTTACDDKITLDNAGRYYNATFTIQATPTLSSTNPTTCNGTEGTITIGGLAPSTVYAVSYTDDGTAVGPTDLTSDASGNIVISGLNPGIYTNFSIATSGCTTPVSGSVTLENPVFTPTFPFANTLSFCKSATVPALPTTSDNGLTGTWTPNVINNTTGGTYTFVPATGQCATNFVLAVNITSLTLQTSKTDNTVCNGSGGSGGGCVSKGTGVVINEVMAQPLDATGCPLNNFGNPTCQGITRREYIELYNPTCTPIDISCHILGSASNSDANPRSTTSFDFSVIIPANTILQPKSHYVIGGSSASSDQNNIDFKVDLNVSNLCTISGRSLLPNGDGWVALYDATGNALDGIYWTVSENQAFKINDDDDLNDKPCVSTVPGCSNAGLILQSAIEIYASNASLMNYVGKTNTTTSILNPAPNGKTFSRIPDGGAWQRDVNPSIDGSNCNNGQCDTPTPSTGTCNGTASVTVTGGTAPYAYEWKDAQKNIVSTLVSASALCPGEYCVKITDNTGCADSVCVTILDAAVQVTPEFDAIAPLCAGATVPVLPATSKNNITGSWNPATVDNQNTATYTFTPDAGQCASPVNLSVTINSKQEPLFDPVVGFCQGAILPQVLLPTTSNNGITGTWNPPGLSSDVAGDILYVFTPAAGVCADTASLIVRVTANTTPTFSFGSALTICAGGNVPQLPAASDNGVTGTWSPTLVDNQNNGTYTFTPDAGQCATTATFTVTVNQPVNPTFPYGTSLTVCSGDPTPNLQGISNNNIVGLWNPANVSNTQSDVYTFTPAPGTCATNATFTVTVIQRPNVTVRPDTTLYHNAVYPGDIFSGLPAGSTVSWINSNPGIGLPSSGNGNVPAFTAINIGSNPVTATITVNSTNGNCAGTVRTYKITVLPLNRDVFVPNVFTPNGDAKNDQLFVFGNYITKLEMRIFNQWGELVKVINNPSVGWDGTHKGKPQPVGVYVYTLRATLADGTEVNKKGSITLLR